MGVALLLKCFTRVEYLVECVDVIRGRLGGASALGTASPRQIYNSLVSWPPSTAAQPRTLVLQLDIKAARCKAKANHHLECRM